MKSRVFLLALLAVAPVAAQPAPRVATSLPAAERAALEKIRKDVWVNWFGGDTAALRRVLGPELVAISGDSKHWVDLNQSLAESVQFRAGGGKLNSVSFDSTTIHRFGDVVVMFSHYHLRFVSAGKPVDQRGRATEVFVKSSGRWVHTSWHLDTTS